MSPTFAPSSLTDHKNFPHPAPDTSQATHRSALAAVALGIVSMLGLFASVQRAAADFRLCNNTGSRVGVAVGYKEVETWTTEGWWNLPSRTCETVLKGNLV